MGRKALHNREQVFEAANQLAATGQAVSPTTLRTTLGGGSLTTLCKHVAAWEANRPPGFQPTAATTLPATIEQAFAHAWQIAVAEAGKDIATIREQSEAAAKDMSQQLEETLKLIAQLKSAAQSDIAKMDTLKSALAVSRAETTQAKADAAAREATLIAGFKPLQQELKTQQVECRQLQKQNKELIAQSAKLKGQCEALQVQIKAQSTLLAQALPGKNRSSALYKAIQ